MATEGEKVEMEQVPLKTDTDETKKEEETRTIEVKKEAPKKTWFFQKDKKKVVDDIEDDKKKEKKTCKFFTCKKKTTEEGDKPEMTIGIDMQMRDEKQINDHVKIQFDDVFGEPETFHSYDCTWRASNRIFECTRTFFFKLFSAIIFFPAAFIFAILFAFLSAFNVWIVMPFAKLLSIPLTWISKAWSFLISNIFDPITKSFGLCLSSVNVRKYGINNSPTHLIQA